MTLTSFPRYFAFAGLSVLTGSLSACGGGSSGAPAGIPAPVPAAITAQLLAVTVADGGTANFTMIATGAAPLVYQWQRNGVALIDAVGIVGSATNALTLTSPYAFNSSQIAVSVSNAAGKILSGAAMLTVTAAAPSAALRGACETVTDAAAYALIGSDQAPQIAIDANGEAVVVWYQQTDTPFTHGIGARVYR